MRRLALLLPVAACALLVLSGPAASADEAAPSTQPTTLPTAKAAKAAKAGKRGWEKFGKPLQGLAPAKLVDVLANPQDGAPVRLEGSVAAVCKVKGCWLELAQDNSSVHVTFEGYSFFVPLDAQGRKVTLEGRVRVAEPDPAMVEHLQGEGAGEAASRKVSIEATGVEMRKVAQR